MSDVALAHPGFADRIQMLAEKVRYRLAVTPKDRDAIYALRYDGFRREKNIPPNFTRRFTDDFDNLENAYIFGVHIDGVLASTLRIHALSPAHPHGAVAAVYPDVVKPWLDEGQTIVDGNRLVVDTAIARIYPELVYLTVRLAVVASEHFKADKSLATVRPEHTAFYKRMFNQRPAAPPGNFPGIASPIVLMVTDFQESREGIYKRYPFFQSSPAERQALFGSGDALMPTVRPTATPTLVPLGA